MSFSNPKSETCPLCEHSGFEELTRTPPTERAYLHCQRCDLVFVPSRYHLSSREEKARYDTHQNDPTDTGYRAFLSKLSTPLTARLKPYAKGMDFGCGPGPALSVMLEEKGFEVANYDPFYRPSKAVLTLTYDFVTCSETVEHFRRPSEEFSRLNTLLKPKGLLAIMTEMPASWENFSNWYYPGDPTHICFYSHTTMKWLANQHGWDYSFAHPNVVIFQKS